jgi:hypothetical protein
MMMCKFGADLGAVVSKSSVGVKQVSSLKNKIPCCKLMLLKLFYVILEVL